MKPSGRSGPPRCNSAAQEAAGKHSPDSPNSRSSSPTCPPPRNGASANSTPSATCSTATPGSRPPSNQPDHKPDHVTPLTLGEYIRSQPPGTSGTVAPTSGRCSYGPSYSIGLTISGAKAAVLLAESNRLIAFCVLPAYRETSQHQAASLGGS